MENENRMELVAVTNKSAGRIAAEVTLGVGLAAVAVGAVVYIGMPVTDRAMSAVGRTWDRMWEPSAKEKALANPAVQKILSDLENGKNVTVVTQTAPAPAPQATTVTTQTTVTPAGQSA